MKKNLLCILLIAIMCLSGCGKKELGRDVLEKIAENTAMKDMYTKIEDASDEDIEFLFEQIDNLVDGKIEDISVKSITDGYELTITTSDSTYYANVDRFAAHLKELREGGKEGMYLYAE